MKKILIILLTLIIILVLQKQTQEEIIIPNNSIRFRIIASTNSEIDVQTKQNLKNYLEQELLNLTKDSNTEEEVDKIIVDNLELINTKVSNYLKNDKYKIDYGLNYFPSKTYKGVIYEAGIYKSLVVTIGDGLGKNWWCTLFPPLCLLEENTTTNDVEYKLFITSIIDKFK